MGRGGDQQGRRHQRQEAGDGGAGHPGRSAVGIQAVNRLISVDKTPVFITAWSGVVKAVAPIANDNKVVELSVGANAPDIAKLGDYVYTTFPLADVDIRAVAEYSAKELGKKRAAVLFINNETGLGSAVVYRDHLHQGGRHHRRLRGLRPEGDGLHRAAAEDPGREPRNRPSAGTGGRVAAGDRAGAPARHHGADHVVFGHLQSQADRAARRGSRGRDRHLARTGRRGFAGGEGPMSTAG